MSFKGILLIILLVIVVAVVSALITRFFVIRKDEKRIGEYQDKVLKTQRDEVENIYQTMRGWRHDYHNHMQTIKANLMMNRVDDTLSYLEHLEEDLDSIDIAIKTGNVSVDAILSSKVSIAVKRNINVDCTAQVPKDVAVSDVDLCTIIGNLLDNAIESCERVAGEKQFIRIYIGTMKKQLYISVSNSTDMKKRKPISSFSSSKAGDHGFGLRRIDLVTEKYHGYVNRQNEPGIFATEVLLPL